MEILIAGDLVPTQSNFDLFNNADVDTLLGQELLSLWNSADIRIFNLEVPITDEENPIKKCGQNLIASTSTINGIKALNPSLITLANNHILDQGQTGLNSTKEILNKNEIPFVGVGDNIFEASKPYIIQKDGSNIGIYACAEYEFSIATEESPGANSFDPLESLDHIENLKSKCDYVIVLYHGGKEYYRYPSPYLQKACRKMAKKGADLIICQHSHCIGSLEKYEGATIVYGQGNFIFDDSDDEFWSTSLLVKVNVDSRINTDYIPLTKVKNTIRLADRKTSEVIMQAFERRSNEILMDGFVKKKYSEFAQDNIQSYLRSFSGYGKWLSRIDRRLLNGALLRRKFNLRLLLSLQNYVECEAHRELLIKGLSSISQKKE